MDEAFDLIFLQPDSLDGFEHRINRRMRTRWNLGDPGFGGITPDGNNVRKRPPMSVPTSHSLFKPFIPFLVRPLPSSAPNKTTTEATLLATQVAKSSWR